MNALELYKKLPRKNCGQCRFRTCMPFALSVTNGSADLSECPLLTSEEIKSLKSSFEPSDWREDLVSKLREEVKRTDFHNISEGLGAEVSSDTMILQCFGREFSISFDGEIRTKGEMSPWIKILLLHYIRTAGKGDLTGRWVSYSQLRGGAVKISSFQRECEEPLRELFDRDFGRASMLLSRMDAKKQDGLPTPNAWKAYLLPKMPVLILYWPEEEEFASKVKILFDSTADRFLDAESIIFLVEGLVRSMEAFSAEVRT